MLGQYALVNMHELKLKRLRMLSVFAQISQASIALWPWVMGQFSKVEFIVSVIVDPVIVLRVAGKRCRVLFSASAGLGAMRSLGLSAMLWLSCFCAVLCTALFAVTKELLSAWLLCVHAGSMGRRSVRSYADSLLGNVMPKESCRVGTRMRGWACSGPRLLRPVHALE